MASVDQQTDRYDLVVVGGGINGAGIARDAAGRGLRTLLVEQGDLANYTSSASTKLVHGGLRYLEQYEFKLVRKALKEREVLMGIAPHIIWPLNFVMPHVKELRPAWMIRMGLFLYDNLGGRKKLPGSKGLDLQTHYAGAPLKDGLKKGFMYSDCWVQDSRLVVLNCMDVEQRGGKVMPRTRCTGAERGNDEWSVQLTDTVSGNVHNVRSRSVVNAAGPWVAKFLGSATEVDNKKDVHLVKGSHIVVPKMFDHEDSYLFQNTDGRVIFAIPYEQDFTLIGTTDVAYEGNPAEATASHDEIQYLCDAVNRYFEQETTPKDVVWTYSGVRALYDESDESDVSAVSRDYSLDLDDKAAPLLSVFGGKITTYRTLARQAVDQIAPLLGASIADWTGNEALPGGDIPDGDFESYLAQLRRERPWLPEAMAWRLVRNYGTRIETMLGGARSLDDLGEHFGSDCYEAELRYLAEHEWAMTADDAIWRRSKLGLMLDAEQRERVNAWYTGQEKKRATA
ncbi:glycerol-3-phosphate dehydrogenase [Spiribacter vilamensis]|uniref:Glycerol-3-phosphate dehydrogenase n=1 Tax=Spiribacter vilamensis TaxID=531306 RepID=A0A4Q8D2S4_9GAMM|nr:glycerol-3-phosphate dehydrogenase [Spiribacter vilamensis]RZU99663.1 homodimeric glycerol 3-phosphate dehydrogenase (quinone) [Spiribacter vilamensis]TVO61383.1 glycerol-3-phosphate dehydrogenase [Spiribacter vilamensis]